MDKGGSPSLLKVYVAAIAASHTPIAGQSAGRNNLVVRFLKGYRRLNPSTLHNPYVRLAYCSEGPEGPSLWGATVCRPTIPVAKNRLASGASIGQTDG